MLAASMQSESNMVMGKIEQVGWVHAQDTSMSTVLLNISIVSSAFGRYDHTSSKKSLLASRNTILSLHRKHAKGRICHALSYVQNSVCR